MRTVRTTQAVSPVAGEAASPMNLIRLRDTCMHFGSRVALAPTDLVCTRSESVAVIGANGSGKSTLLNLIAGLIKPTDGKVEVDGAVAFVGQHQHHHQWMPLSVEEVLRMGRYRSWIGRMGRADRIAIDRAAEQLEIADLLKRSFGVLSGGQRQRVLVAKAVATESDVLLLDEPITGLDLPSQQIILDVIEDHSARGGTAVFTTHHLGEARRADRVLLLAGCVLADGSPEEVLVPELLAEAFGGRMVAGEAVVVDEHHHHDLEQHAGATDLSAHLDSHHHHHEHDHDHRGLRGDGHGESL